MQRSMWKFFILLAIIMTFGFVQTGWALECNMDVTGYITDLGDGGEVTVAETTIFGVPDYLQLEVDQNVTITYHESACGDLVACTVTVNTVDDGVVTPEATTILRPGKNKNAEAEIVATVVKGNLDCSKCNLDCEDTCTGSTCTCTMTCECLYK